MFHIHIAGPFFFHSKSKVPNATTTGQLVPIEKFHNHRCRCVTDIQMAAISKDLCQCQFFSPYTLDYARANNACPNIARTETFLTLVIEKQAEEYETHGF
jgi:hypothetical protein